MEIPRGTTPEEFKIRKKIISDFYAQWNAAHPDKKVWNKSLGAYIHVKYLSINETRGRASVSFESTRAILRLTEILGKAAVIKWVPIKKSDKNQRSFDRMVLLLHDGIQLLVGHQRTTNEYVQYCITAKK